MNLKISRQVLNEQAGISLAVPEACLDFIHILGKKTRYEYFDQASRKNQLSWQRAGQDELMMR